MWQAYQQMSTRKITHYTDIPLYSTSEIWSVVKDPSLLVDGKFIGAFKPIQFFDLVSQRGRASLKL